MRFLLDAHLPPALAASMRVAGHDCEHVATLLAPDASDIVIAETANRLGAILVTKDADFVELLARGGLSVPLVWVRLGNMTARATAAALIPLLPQVAAAVESGESLIEIKQPAT